MQAVSRDDSRIDWVERWLSAPRFAVYLGTTEGDRDAALSLYEWNAQLSSAFTHDLAHVEVGLRNAYDRALTDHLDLPGHWTACGDQVFASLPRTRGRGRARKVVDVNEKPRANLRRAIRDAGGPAAPPGKVIAQLTFGFWRYLTSAAHDVDLWRPALHHAYPIGTRRSDVDEIIGDLHTLRNRVAHHEPLIGMDVAILHTQLLEIAALLNPHLGTYVAEHSEVPRVLRLIGDLDP